MADRLNVTELDFDSIKTNLKNFLKQQSVFEDYDFEGSGLSVLLDILAYNTHYNAYYLNMVANESFLDSAILRNNVVSHAKRIGYTPRSSTASRALINLTVNSGSSTPGTLTIPAGQGFYSNQIDGISYRFNTLESKTVAKTANNFIFTNLPIYEGKLLTYTYTNDYSSNPNQVFTIPDTKVDTSTLIVGVRQSSSNNETIIYERSEDVLVVDNSSEVYYVQEGNDGNYQIYFGDDVISKKIPDGAIVSITYLSTNADAANYANNFVSVESIGGYTDHTVDPVIAAAGGSTRETVDQIKYAAPLALLSQNRAVTKNDYIRLIQQKYPQFEAVNVWGGEENVPPVYGKVFISAKPKLGFEITQTEKEYVKQNIIRPISMLTIVPEIVDIDYNYLKVQSSVYYNKSKSTLNKSQMQSAIRNLIVNYADQQLNQFNTYFRYSGLESAIDSYDRSIVSNEIDLFVGKKFRPNLTISNNYVLDFGFELIKGTTSDNFYSTPNFNVEDSDGIIRQCFFEEIPSSYTGVQSITVTNPGYGYTETPTIEIVGDGTGAVAVANIVNEKLVSIDVTNPGIGYTSAIVRIIGGNGLLGEASVVLEGRYGQIRIAYYKTDEINSQSTKVIINANKNNGVMGTIDYVMGKIYLDNFLPTSVNNDFGDIIIYMRPKSNVIQSKLNKMLVLDAEDLTSIEVMVTEI